MVGDAIFSKIMSDIRRMKTSNDIKFIREHLKQTEMLLGLYREEISNLGDYVLSIPAEDMSTEGEQCQPADVPW